SPRFSRQRRMSAVSSVSMMMRASEPPMKWRRVSTGLIQTFDLTFPSMNEQQTFVGTDRARPQSARASSDKSPYVVCNKRESIFSRPSKVSCQSQSNRKDSILMLFAAQIRAARALLDWRQDDLARAAKVGITTVRRIEAQPGPVMGYVSTVLRIQATLEKAGI